MKSTIIAIAAGIVLIGVAVFAVDGGSADQQKPSADARNVTFVDGTQIVEIQTKGGYQPAKSIAKAGVPTILRFATNGTFDCSASVRIPSMKISKDLPNSGNTDIAIGSPQVATLQGTCGMGMYTFEVEFQG